MSVGGRAACTLMMPVKRPATNHVPDNMAASENVLVQSHEVRKVPHGKKKAPKRVHAIKSECEQRERRVWHSTPESLVHE